MHPHKGFRPKIALLASQATAGVGPSRAGEAVCGDCWRLQRALFPSGRSSGYKVFDILSNIRDAKVDFMNETVLVYTSLNGGLIHLLK